MALLEAKNLSITFGGLKAVDDFNVEIEKGELYGLIGPNGAGKTTIFNLLTGVYKPTEGQATLDGTVITGKKTIDICKAGVARTFQNIRLFGQMSVLDNVKVGLHNHYKYNTAAGIFKLPSYFKKERAMDEKAMELLKVFDLDKEASYLSSNLPYGKQRKLEIARALATNPKVLLCDEATSALDPKTTRQILELIRDINKKLGITVVIITHQMSVVKEVCNHVAILDDGIIAEEGLVSSVFTSPKSEAARHLVFPGGEDMTVSDPLHERRLKLTFLNVAATSVPLVARLATEEGISANVISATTQKLSDEIYGSMLLGIPNSQFDKATAFLKNFENIKVEEVSADD